MKDAPSTEATVHRCQQTAIESATALTQGLHPDQPVCMLAIARLSAPLQLQRLRGYQECEDTHAVLPLLELVPTMFAGPRVMGSLDLRSIGTARRACKALHNVPLESYLSRVFEHSLPSDTSDLQRILHECVCGPLQGSAWPPFVWGFALPTILRTLGSNVSCLVDPTITNNRWRMQMP